MLADEINRASPKTQSALLEAMQERRVTVLGKTHDLPKPFFVLATQNLIELEGTYPLSEALFTPNASVLDAELRSKFSGGYGGSSDFAAKFDPKQLPADWLAFSGYDSVILTDSDWSEIPPGSRNALLSWVRMGGQLVIYSSGSATAAAMGLPTESGFGQIEIRSIPADLKLDAPEVVKLVTKNPTKPLQVSVRNNFSGYSGHRHFVMPCLSSSSSCSPSSSVLSIYLFSRNPANVISFSSPLLSSR